MRAGLSTQLPDFPWDTLAGDRELAASHPGGLVDLSVGTPVDATPRFIQQALAAAADAPGYPTVWGTSALHQAIIDYLQRRWSAQDLTPREVLPVIGTKELVGWLPTLLGLGPQDLVVIPTTAYPTYEVGAIMAGTQIQRCDRPQQVVGHPQLIWINSPANPHGAVLSRGQLLDWMDFARGTGALLASDECYGEFAWDADSASILDEHLCGADHTGLLAVHSLSKRSNLAGYRAGFLAGDAEVVGELLALRKHLGMMVPTPVQAAMVAALGDQRHVEEQRQRYLTRRQRMRAVLTGRGFRIDHSEGSLYLWATRDEPCRDTVHWLAQRGILVAPGDFYGPAGARHVRIALTATDERIGAAVDRISSS